VTFYYASVSAEKKNSQPTSVVREFSLILLEKETGKYNKTRINIGHQHDRWMELKEALRLMGYSLF
jgi:DNA repair photolyase